MSAITREIVFKSTDENHCAIVKGNSIELISNYKSSGPIDIQDAELFIDLFLALKRNSAIDIQEADLLIDLLREAIKEARQWD